MSFLSIKIQLKQPNHRQKMALGSFSLFVGQAEKASLSLRVKALQTMFDMMILYPNDLLYAKNGEQVRFPSFQESPRQ
jgi:hypothetical protein